MDIKDVIGKHYHVFEEKHDLNHYIELLEGSNLGKDQDHKQIVDAFLTFVKDTKVTVLKMIDDKIDQVVDLSNEELKTNLYLLGDQKGLFFPKDWEVSYAFASEDFFVYFMPNTFLFSANKKNCQVMKDVLDTFKLKYVESCKCKTYKNDKEPVRYLQLKISLEGITPEIWRRFIVRSDMSFHELHNVIQIVMGWENYHMYRFKIGDVYIEGEGEDSFCVDGMWRDNKFAESIPFYAKDVAIKKYLTKEKQVCEYVYDYGDAWCHRITVEKIDSEGTNAAVVLDGKRSGPPEDCGGVFGYEELLEVQKDKTHDLYQERIVEWLGKDFDPEFFDKNSINGMLDDGGFWMDRQIEVMNRSDVKKRKLGRNEPCYCGSGKKYKKCCLSEDMEEIGRQRKIAV